MLEAAIFVIFPFCMVFAAVSDLVSMTIANRVSILLVASFAVIAPFTGMDWTTYGLHMAAGLLALTATFALFATGSMGGGDAKLIASTAVWMGLSDLMLEYLIYTGLIGGAITLAILFYRKSPFATYSEHLTLFRHLADDKAGIPYGLALGACGLLLFPKTPLAVWALTQVATP